ncbi:MAG TPA: EamA family transporter [Methylomirabilota bacterium]|nr:EamA family transporter [Methylomirabilota bacterium]
MGLAFAYAVLTGVLMAVYTVLARVASPGIHPVLGTTILMGVGFLLNLLAMGVTTVTGAQIAFSTRSALLLIAVGAATAGMNLCTLLAYAHGLRVTSSFVIGGTSTVLVLLVGFLVLEEPFSWTKLLAIGLITAGTVLLQRSSS